VENCQTVVFAAYVTARAHTLFDFRLYLPRQWCGDEPRRQRARVPDEVEFATKPALGTAMITAAASAGVPFAWAAAGEVHGRSGKLREACEKNNKGYVLAVPVNFTVTLPSGRKTAVAAVARLIPAAAWETRLCGPGCKGHRDYARAWAATASPRHWVLIRRSMGDPDDLAFFYTHSTATPCCPCAPRPCWPSPPPARPRPPPSLPPPAATSSPKPGATPASCPPPPMTSRPAMTPAWSRSASPKPAGSCAWPPHR